MQGLWSSLCRAGPSTLPVGDARPTTPLPALPSLRLPSSLGTAPPASSLRPHAQSPRLLPRLRSGAAASHPTGRGSNKKWCPSFQGAPWPLGAGSPVWRCRGRRPHSELLRAAHGGDLKLVRVWAGTRGQIPSQTSQSSFSGRFRCANSSSTHEHSSADEAAESLLADAATPEPPTGTSTPWQELTDSCPPQWRPPTVRPSISARAPPRSSCSSTHPGPAGSSANSFVLSEEEGQSGHAPAWPAPQQGQVRRVEGGALPGPALLGRRAPLLTLAAAAAGATLARDSAMAAVLDQALSDTGESASAPVPIQGPQAEADGPGTSLRSQLLRGLGIGEPDVYYPRVFLGEWECESILLSVDTPQGQDVADVRASNEARRRIGAPVVYSAKFVEYGGNVIAERLLTTTSLVEGTVGKGVLVDAEWTPSKANVLTLTLKGGIKVRNLVTKRSFELSAPGQFDVSEYSKQVFDNAVSVEGPPSIKASGNLTRFRWDLSANPVQEIEAFQRVAMYPVVGGAAAGRGDAGLTAMDVLNLGFGEKPTTVYKYLLHMKRVS